MVVAEQMQFLAPNIKAKLGHHALIRRTGDMCFTEGPNGMPA
jgi:hypothetical protein